MNWRFFKNRAVFFAQKAFVAWMLILLAFTDAAPFMGVLIQPRAEAAEVTIDGTVTTADVENAILGPATVFISDQVGYKFYVDSTGTCVYSKTTNGGTSWGAAVTIDAQTDCASPVVWYDRWTPGDTGNFIHIATFDPGNDDVWYNRLDTTSDTRLLGTTPVSVSLTPLGALAAGTNLPTITKGTDGTIYIGVNSTDSFIMECTINCNIAGNWVEIGNSTSPLDNANDFMLLVPLLNGEIMAIRRDVSTEDVQSRIWDNSTWTGSWATIDSNSVDEATFDGGLAAVSTEDGEVYLAHTSLNATYINGSHDLRTAKYSGGSWSVTADVVTNTTGGLGYVSILRDLNNDDIYVAYNRRTTIGTAASANVYWATSTSAMTTWTAEQGPVNTGAVDIHGVDLNYASDERVHVAWHEDNPTGNDFVMGDTIRDISPTVIVSASGTQATVVRASTTNFYVGGRFVIDENITTRNVTSIEITENGTVDASTGLSNIKLFYEFDTSAPYNCDSESYAGTETQYGITDTNGFSGANGVSIFTDTVSISPTQAMCVYVVLDVLKTADDQSRIEIEITDPSTDVVVSGGVAPVPSSATAITGSTTVADDVLTQTHYHWRNDNGTETTATSRTGGIQNTAIAALQQNTPVRLRLGVSNEGSTTTVPMTLRLEYSTTSGACSTATGWTDVGATNDDWNMFDSTNLTNGNNTTNIATSTGGVTDENTTFLVANGAVRDTSSSLGALTFSTTTFAEAEFSIVASTTAIEGRTYCFRLTDNGAPLSVYSQYPQVTIAADVTVSATGTQAASTHVGASNVYLGGAFRFVENSSSRNVTNIVLTEQGSANGLEGLGNIRIYYDLDTTAPYDCASESYSGAELQFGSVASAFSADNGTSSFSGSVAISTTQTMCAYVVYDVTESARNAETVDITIGSGANDVTVSGGGSVSPSTALNISGTTNINGEVVTQTHYHWRNDNGSETTATSRTGGVDDTLVADFDLNAPTRLRFGISNEGATSSLPRRYQLEYGIKVTTCDAVSVWTDVGATNDAWNMFDSPNLTNGETTTNIPEVDGGVADENPTFLGSNTNVRDTESLSGTTTLTSTEHTDLEYSITSTATTSYETTYCFRVTKGGVPLANYATYAEITTVPKRDFRIQRNTATITGTSTTLIAGVDYTAPSASTSAFIRITNTHHTGAGTSGAGSTQNADDVTAYILNPSNIMTSITIARPNTAINNTRVSWEIVEFVGASSTDNQMIVRAQATATITGTNTFATTTINGPISDDGDVVVFITGLRNLDTLTNYPRGQVTSSWSSSTNQAVFQRVANGSTVDISFAVVEFVGQNWKVQRVEHQYTASGTPETKNITAVNSINRTFLHTQRRTGAAAVQINFGHEVYLSSIGSVTFQLPAGASTTNQTSVAWVIENTQTANGAMVVQRGNGNITGGPITEPRITSINLVTPVNALNNSSIFTMTAHGQATANFPRVLAAVTLTSTTTYELWSSDIDNTQNHWYRTEVVQWPVVDLSVRQNYYRFYVDNGGQTPTDPWPVGANNLGENTTITAADAPLGDGDVIRMRTTLQVSNATLPAGFLSLKLQYALRDSTCSAVETWTDVGNLASSTIWRGHNTSVTDGVALSTNPPTGGDVLISITDRAGRLVEQNPSAANPYGVAAGEDVEYDWVVAHNGAQSDATYCFRMVKSDGTTLDAYNNYPQIRTAGFTPVTQNWRWYTDAESETPVSALAAENTAPIDVDDGESVALRVTVDERKMVPGNNVKFAVQFSEYPDFRVASTAVATSTCTATSTWCYFNGGGVNNATITTRVLTDADSCVGGVGTGCGTHNESSDPSTGFIHTAGSAREYSFTLVNAGARVNRVYYFRVFDVNAAAAVNASTSYPSLVTKGGSLVFESASVGNGVATEGIITDATSTPTQISFGRLPFGSSFEAAYRLSVQTNATEGYQLLMYTDQPLSDSSGNTIQSIAGTNANPVAWNIGCTGLPSCFGYHVGDDSLSGTSTRFAPNDTYAAFSTTTPQEVMYSSRTSTADQSDLIVRIQTTEEQPAGIYENSLIFIAIPSY